MPHPVAPPPAKSAQEPSGFLEARGLSAAWVLLKVARAIKALEPGQVLEVLGSDPKLLSDLPLVLECHGCRLVRVEHGQGEYRFLLTRRGPSEPGPGRAGCARGAERT